MKIPQNPPSQESLLKEPENVEMLLRLFMSGIGPAPNGKYRHWDTLRRIRPPEGLSIEQYWLAQKIARFQSRRDVHLLFDTDGAHFHYTLPDPLLAMLHEIDKNASGDLASSEPITNPRIRNRYIQRSLIEESITSSQLEGAATTRRVAKEMIRSGRRPSNTSERMILNNYYAMIKIRELRNEPLSRHLIEEIHSILTYEIVGENENPYRILGDGIAVYDNADNTLLHTPPKADEAQERIRRLCKFANSENESAFLHPAIKAIIIHFWFAYDHPFIDGNGRTARALFYWSMLREGFWLLEFISISRILKMAPARYGRSFLYTETDDNDLTYFILSQLRVIIRAIDDLNQYLADKMLAVRQTEELLKPSLELNNRQVSVIGHALRNPGAEYTIESHKNSQRVTYQTSRTDLLDLVDKKLLERFKKGRKLIFRVPEDLGDNLAKIG